MRFPSAPYAAWNALLQNLLANAWNAMLVSGGNRVAVDAEIDGDDQRVIVSDTGAGLGMSLRETARLFEPFERALEVPEEQETLVIGGYGLGLTISRMITRQYDAKIRFVKPREGFATSIAIEWKQQPEG